MDPDTALAEIRVIMGLIKAHRRMTPCQLTRLAELWEGLDDWLARQHGFLPAAWRPAT